MRPDHLSIPIEATEQFKNKSMTSFQNEVGPGILQSGVQQTYNLLIIHRIRTKTTYNLLHMVCAFGILAALGFLERWAGALQVQSRFQTA